jgi:DNA-binding LacI/PurR family transcriptional regulator
MGEKNQPVTMAEIASKAGVSKATVSRALAGSSLIGKDVRCRVEREASNLGYQRRTIKRPAERSILTVKLVLPPESNRTARLFYSLNDLVDGLRRGIAPAGLNLIVETNSPSFTPFPHKKSGETAAFLFAFHRPSKATLDQIKQAGTRIMLLNRTAHDLPSVTSDHADAMAQIAGHLAEKKITENLSFVTYQGITEVSQARLKGFSQACQKLGLTFDPLKDTLTLESPDKLTPEDLLSLLKKGTTTFVGVNDVIASLLVQQAHQAGLKIPADLIVTGCDNGPSRTLTIPKITTVDLSIRALAQEAGSRLYQHIVENEKIETSLLRGMLLKGDTT